MNGITDYVSLELKPLLLCQASIVLKHRRIRRSIHFLVLPLFLFTCALGNNDQNRASLEISERRSILVG